MTRHVLILAYVAVCLLCVRCTVSPGETQTLSHESCASCGLSQSMQADRLDTDFLEAVKRHILNRLQMRERPNITHSIPKAAMVMALRKLHAGKVREDGRVEIPNLDGHANYINEVQEETSEIISFAESGVYLITSALSDPLRLQWWSPKMCSVHLLSCTLLLLTLGCH